MVKQAKHLIDDARFHMKDIATSWDYDNRVTSNKEDVFPSRIVDDHSGMGIRYKRDFLKQTQGRFMLEMLYIAEHSPDGVCVKICSSHDKTLFEVKTAEGFWYFNGQKTSQKAVLGENRFRVDFDLDEHTATFVVDGASGGSFSLDSIDEISKMYIGSTGDTHISIQPVKVRLIMDYIAYESFVYVANNVPETFATKGDVKIKAHDGVNPQMNYTYASIAGKGEAVRSFKKTTDDIIAEGYMLLPTGDDNAELCLVSGDQKIFGVTTKNNSFLTLDGTFLRKFTTNVWQDIRFETKDGSVTVKIDGKIVGKFPISKTEFDGIKFEFAPGEDSAELCFADIVVENVVEYEDYCPEPKQVRHPEYEVGVNVCNMWREGYHFGWDYITYFKDNTPLIGPYDEGLPEVADWEIKFMTEHGITFQHFCWYCPDPKINFPIKRSRMDNALRDGYMNARYSDKMKFMIMWENNTYNNTNPEDFKNYVWKYWCEYFFTDPRYLKVDNKPVLSLWSFRFVEHWGGHEKAKEIIAFMNEDIKNYGCDGIILTATANMGGKYEYLSEYCDYTYSYHFGKEGYVAEHQIKAIDELREYVDKGYAPYMQTASVGFNSCPWHGADARVPLISLDDYERVLRHIKDFSDSREDKKWYHKLFMMSTWNEYGEGTYIMPSHIHGFGYLDRIRKVFVPESGKCENLLPDDSQASRISYLRVPDRVMIRRLGYEKSEEVKVPNTIVMTTDFSQAPSEWQGYNDAVKAEFTGSSILVTPVADYEHYSVVCRGKDGVIIKADEATNMRLYIRATEDFSQIRVAFLTDTDKKWASNKCDPRQILLKSDDYVVMDFAPGRFPTWTGDITEIRIDGMNKTPFEIRKIEWLIYKDLSECEPKVYVNGVELCSAFDPICCDGDLVVSLNPGLGYGNFRMLKLYHEYDILKRQLYVASKDTEIVFTIDSAIAKVNGKTVTLTAPVRMRDGLPTLKIGELCDLLGYRYTLDDKNKFNITL